MNLYPEVTKQFSFQLEVKCVALMILIILDGPVNFVILASFWTDIPDKDTFEKILNYVNNISSEKWNKILNKHNIKNIITLDKNKKILKTVQEKIL